MKWISSTPAGKGSSYTYDAVGNTEVRDLPDATQNLTWTAENKLDTITDDAKKTTYVYDASGNRLLENSPSGSTLYLGETELTTDTTGKITRASRAYGQAGAPTVVRATTNGATTGHKLSVLLADHVGTASTTVELSSGQAVTRRAFKPYGEARGPKPSTWPNKRSYLGVGIDDATTGLTHIGAREYDQNTGRFLSADPVIDIADPLQMNGYAYSGNSPVSKSDPTGLCPFIDCPTRPDANAENTTPGQKPGKRKNSQNYQGALDRGTANPAVTIPSNKFTEIYPGVYVSKSWKYANDFARLLNERIDTHCQEQAGCLLDAQDGEEAEADRQQLMHLKFLACMTLGWRSSCLGKVASIQASMSFLSSLPGGEGPGLTGRSKGGGKKGGGKKGSACDQCFLAGTDVLMSDGSTKDIEDVKPGDKVQATDPKSGESGPRRVTRLIITEDDKYFNELSIVTRDGIEKLTATYEHPFWSPSERDWVEAGALTPGMTLLTDAGDTVIVTGNRSFTKHARTYNLTVDDLHTYYVLAGETPVLVHNSNCGHVGVSLSGARQVSGRFPETAGPGEILFRQQQDGTVTAYARYDADGAILQRADLLPTSKAHAGIPAPHILDMEKHVNPKTGQVFRNWAKNPRPLRPEEELCGCR